MAKSWLGALLVLACAAGCGDDDDKTTDTGKDAGSGSCTTQMYDKYGQAGFEAVNKNILENIGTVSAMSPSPIGDSFKGLRPVQVEAVEASLLDFLVMVYGGPNNYKGQTMKASHAALEITQAQYDAFISMVVVPALSKAGVPESDINDCFAPPVVDPAFVADIVTKEASDDEADAGGKEPDAGEVSCTGQMYDKYKQAGFEAVNANILENVGTVSAMNPSPIGDSFKGLTPEQVAAVEANLLDFLVMVYGGPNNYKGKSMKDSHAGLEITQAQYDAFIGMVVVPALSKAGVPEADINNCFAPPVVDPAFVADIVTK